MASFSKNILFLLLSCIFFTGFIIIRHDVSDQKYIQFAEELSATSAIVHYNATDLAGTLISPQWVLSAAHVAETIRDGHKLIINGDSIGIEKIFIHEEWKENNRPDLALIKLDQTVGDVEPIGLYDKQDEVGKDIIVAGIGDFGTGLTGPVGNPGTMRAATNLVDGISGDGQYIYWEFDGPESEKVTDLEGISGPGDSAGPALIKIDNRYLIVGISSGQSSRSTGGKPGRYGVVEYYTRVSVFTDWIRENISDQ